MVKKLRVPLHVQCGWGQQNFVQKNQTYYHLNLTKIHPALVGRSWSNWRFEAEIHTHIHMQVLLKTVLDRVDVLLTTNHCVSAFVGKFYAICWIYLSPQPARVTSVMIKV